MLKLTINNGKEGFIFLLQNEEIHVKGTAAFAFWCLILFELLNVTYNSPNFCPSLHLLSESRRCHLPWSIFKTIPHLRNQLRHVRSQLTALLPVAFVKFSSGRAVVQGPVLMNLLWFHNQLYLLAVGEECGNSAL